MWLVAGLAAMITGTMSSGECVWLEKDFYLDSECTAGRLGVSTDESIELSASDSHTAITSANYARLNNESGGGAWCIGTVLAGDQSQYLQIDLGGRARIDGLLLQGRFNGTEGVDKLLISVLRDDQWLIVDEVGGTTVDNMEEYAIEPIVASSVRLHPVTDRSKPVCMRVELVGCFTGDDDFKSYQLSRAPSGTLGERGLINLQGQGRLSDGIIDKYLRFNGGQLAASLEWHVPINVTGTVEGE